MTEANTRAKTDGAVVAVRMEWSEDTGQLGRHKMN